ncbi:hypothetical protein [Duganella vulcania]|uniref:Uncharacterized protein n=1 Tax=Duganella vulcania TaxID=2692166 RepID=A0A845GDH2_9BURK|nr:hypothetical protein [Duganella vulcania]MYM92673.1 hypothetical protein [Duganella vulcania]
MLRLPSKSDADHKSRGFTHRIDAWIHGGGDDKLISIYMVSPTTKQIKNEIRRQGSAVLDDYSLNAL